MRLDRQPSGESKTSEGGAASDAESEDRVSPNDLAAFDFDALKSRYARRRDSSGGFGRRSSESGGNGNYPTLIVKISPLTRLPLIVRSR